jgi:hypothetical protein
MHSESWEVVDKKCYESTGHGLVLIKNGNSIAMLLAYGASSY